MESPVFSPEKDESHLNPVPFVDPSPPPPPFEESSSLTPTSTEEIPDPTPVPDPYDVTVTASTDDGYGSNPEPTSTPPPEIPSNTPEPHRSGAIAPTSTESPDHGLGAIPEPTSIVSPRVSRAPEPSSSGSFITITTTNVSGGPATITTTIDHVQTGEILGTATNGAVGTSHFATSTPQPSPKTNGGLSGGQIAAAVVVPVVVVVSLLLLGILLFLRRRKRKHSRQHSDDATAMYQHPYIAQDDTNNPDRSLSMTQAPPPFTLTAPARNVHRGYGTGIAFSDASTATPASTPHSSALGPPPAAAQRHPLENVRTGPPPPVISAYPAEGGRGGSSYSASSDAWNSPLMSSSFASDPFTDSRGAGVGRGADGGGSSSNPSATWSNFSGAGAAHTGSSSNNTNLAPSSRGPSIMEEPNNDRPLGRTGNGNDENANDILSEVSSLSDEDVEVEVGVAQRASVIDSQCISAPK